MKKVVLLLLLALLLCFAAAQADSAEILGKPFPDFTATDTEGNAFTLSEALKEHEAVLINLWATWCPPCRGEFPDLQAAYEALGDRVAFIALSVEPTDTIQKVADFRAEYGITFPMGRDEDRKLDGYVNSDGIPVTVVVDRFGNAVYVRTGAFFGKSQVTSVLRAVLGEGYTETKVMTEIPPESGTALFPVSGERALIVENPDARRVRILAEGEDTGLFVYVVNDDTARMRIELSAQDAPGNMIYYIAEQGKINMVPELLDSARGAYVCAHEMTDEYGLGILVDYVDDSDGEEIDLYLIPREENIQSFINDLSEAGYNVTWEYAEEEQPDQAAHSAYILRVADQYGQPVPGAFINFCTDTACTMLQTDADGVITFDGARDAYHLSPLKVPEGYSFDASDDFYIGPDYGEWCLRIKKD